VPIRFPRQFPKHFDLDPYLGCIITVRAFERARVVPRPLPYELPAHGANVAAGLALNSVKGAQKKCVACDGTHETGYCPLKTAGVENCGLCGLAHYGHSRTCPHLSSEMQVRTMLEALKKSTEPKPLIQEAIKYLRGIVGDLAQRKRKREAKVQAQQGIGPNGHTTNGVGAKENPPAGPVDGTGAQETPWEV